MMTKKLFVYGSLCNGMVHFPKIQQHVADIQEASILGKAYMLKVGYPVVIASQDQSCEVVPGQADRIPGQILEIQGSELLMFILDEFLGCSMLQPEKGLYHRKQIQARRSPSQLDAHDLNDKILDAIDCDVYSLNPAKLPKDAMYVQGGDWREYFSVDRALPGQLSDRQKQYVHKLGSSSGRDIVPIDLPLYRELMNLGLIVDKGRRLALSALGKEVYRYL
ncbi:MAG: gamma-glutamylcyclotransferase [Pseudobdellovibrionaceae bacterium]